MVSEVERLSREMEALRARVEALERCALPIVQVSAREKRILMRRLAESEAGEVVPWEEVKASLEARRK
jgi:vacuolar-type H+-ATPase subunit D/Vma8